jgi:hypothetical protein
MSYPNRTLLRYHSKVDDTHDTALVLEDGGILHIKRASQPVKERFESVEAWLASLPEKPSAEELEIVEPSEKGGAVVAEREREEKAGAVAEQEREEKAGKEEKKKRATKKKEEKPKKEPLPALLLIPARRQIPSTYWTQHLYRMIREANPSLLRRPDVIHAFNALVQVLLDHQAHVMSHTPSSVKRYCEGVDIEKNPLEHPLRGMCSIRMNSVGRNPNTGNVVLRFPYHYHNFDSTPRLIEDELAIRNQIVATYQTLFVLIRDDVLPYMKRRDGEYRARWMDKGIERIVRRMEAFSENHEKDVKRRMDAIVELEARHQRSMATFRANIAKMSQEKDEMLEL